MRPILILVALAFSQDTADDHVQAGVQKAAQRDLDGALAAFTRAIERDPKHLNAHLQRAAARSRKGDADGALADYTRVNELDPKGGYGHHGRAFVLRQKKDLDGALADLNEEIARRPENGRAYSDRAAVKQERKDLPGALQDFTKALEIQPGNAVALRGRARVKLKAGDADGALADLGKAIEAAPDAPTYAERGGLRYDRNDFRGAAADFGNAIAEYTAVIDDPLGDDATDARLRPLLANGLMLRGMCLNETGDFAQAVEDFNQSVKLAPLQALSYQGRAFARRQLGNLNEAMADFDLAIKLAPGQASGHFSRGNFLYDAGMWPQARVSYQNARKNAAAGGDPYALMRIWLIRAKNGPRERKEATEEVKASVEWKSEDPWTRKILGFLCGDLSEADFLAAAASPDAEVARNQRCEASFYAGAFNMVGGKNARALELYQACLATKVTRFTEYQSSAWELQKILLGAVMATLGPGEGLRVVQVLPKGPFEAAGLKAQDVLGSIDGKPAGSQALLDLLAAVQPGTKLAVSCVRAPDQKLTAEVVVGPR